MSNAPATRPRIRRLARVAAAIGLLVGLAGCVVVPERGYYHGGYYHGGYYHHDYWR